MIEVIDLKTTTFSKSTISEWGEVCLVWGKHSDPVGGSFVLVSDTRDIDDTMVIKQGKRKITRKHSFMWIDQSLLPSLMVWTLGDTREPFENGFALREHLWPTAELEPYELLEAFDCPKSFSGKAYQFDKELVCMDPACSVLASHCHMAQISSELPSAVCPSTRHY